MLALTACSVNQIFKMISVNSIDTRQTDPVLKIFNLFQRDSNSWRATVISETLM
ncbi:MAG: hypothetical protein ACJAQS_000995, partial [Porticoccus sp.]